MVYGEIVTDIAAPEITVGSKVVPSQLSTERLGRGWVIHHTSKRWNDSRNAVEPNRFKSAHTPAFFSLESGTWSYLLRMWERNRIDYGHVPGAPASVFRYLCMRVSSMWADKSTRSTATRGGWEKKKKRATKGSEEKKNKKCHGRESNS